MGNLKQSNKALSVFDAVVLLAIVTCTLLSSTPAQAQERTIFTSLHAFTNGVDGGNPYGTLVQDARGNLYGTSSGGGTYASGTVFKIDVRGRQTVLYSFYNTVADGKDPLEGVVLDAAGNLYGSTSSGGTGPGLGTVFKLDPAGTETVLHNFGSTPDGTIPEGKLVRDAQGNLYGVTVGGGAYRGGTVFSVDPAGNETVLYSFRGGADGDGPYGGLVMDAHGSLYGTTSSGGTLGAGTVFKLDLTGSKTVLYNFGGPDGQYPRGSLIRDGAGNLYGITFFGGAYDKGTVFKLDSAGTETVLHSFSGGADGGLPTAGVIGDAAGNLYGTTSDGGVHFYGTIFALDPIGNLTVLYSFRDGPDGGRPFAGLLRTAGGALYGVTAIGGPYEYGTVFRVTP